MKLIEKKKVNKNENEWKGVLQDNQVVQNYFYQTGESNVTPDSFTVTNTNVRSYEEKALELQEHLKTNPNKPFYWETTKEELNKFYHDNWVKENVSYKQKRIEFEFTPFTFWQLTPSIAINLSMKEIEFVWFCFGMYINWK